MGQAYGGPSSGFARVGRTARSTDPRSESDVDDPARPLDAYVQPGMPQQNAQVNVIAGRRGADHGLRSALTIPACGLWAMVAISSS